MKLYVGLAALLLLMLSDAHAENYNALLGGEHWGGQKGERLDNRMNQSGRGASSYNRVLGTTSSVKRAWSNSKSNLATFQQGQSSQSQWLKNDDRNKNSNMQTSNQWSSEAWDKKWGGNKDYTADLQSQYDKVAKQQKVEDPLLRGSRRAGSNAKIQFNDQMSHRRLR